MSILCHLIIICNFHLHFKTLNSEARPVRTTIMRIATSIQYNKKHLNWWVTKFRIICFIILLTICLEKLTLDGAVINKHKIDTP